MSIPSALWRTHMDKIVELKLTGDVPLIGTLRVNDAGQPYIERADGKTKFFFNALDVVAIADLSHRLW